MKYKSIIELTPLIDVFLILIFAFLINTRQTDDAQRLEQELAMHEVEILQQELAEKQQEMERYRSNLDASELRVKDYEQQLAKQKAVLDTTILTISEKLAVFFEATDLGLQFEVQQGGVSQENYQNFRQKIAQLELDDEQHIIEKIYMLGELEAYSSQIMVYLDSENQIWLDHEATGIRLSDYDEDLDDFPQEAREQFAFRLRDALDQQYNTRKKGERKLGEVVLVTFGHAEDAFRSVIRLASAEVDDFYRETVQLEGNTRKVFYSNLGFYPFSPRPESAIKP